MSFRTATSNLGITWTDVDDEEIDVDVIKEMSNEERITSDEATTLYRAIQVCVEMMMDNMLNELA